MATILHTQPLTVCETVRHKMGTAFNITGLGGGAIHRHNNIEVIGSLHKGFTHVGAEHCVTTRTTVSECLILGRKCCVSQMSSDITSLHCILI